MTNNFIHSVFKSFMFMALMYPIANRSNAQTIQDDFEGNGNIDQWVADDCGLSVNITNPYVDATNGSANVMEYDDAGGTYANVRFDISTSFDLSSSHTFSFKIYVPSSSLSGSQPNQVSLKLQDRLLPQPWTTQSEIIKPIVLDQWQTVTFDFENDAYINLDGNSPAPTTREDFSRVLIQVNGENNNDVVTAYIDDFNYSGDLIEPEPVPEYNVLIWADEFNDGPTLDASKWHHQTLLPNGTGWYNNELQHYTNRIENSYVENGALHIKAIKETFTDQGQTKEYTSARLNSKFAFTYGKIEARAKLPTGVGTWPAIWTLGKNIDEPGGFWQPTHGTVGWPACGEIDIMEHWGNNQNYVQSALHTPSSFGGTVNKGGLVNPTASDSFHIYSMVWSEESIQFSLDGVPYYTYEPSTQNMDTWPFIADQYILLNVAMQGSVDPAFTESEMVIDYIRVYSADSTLATNDLFSENEIKLYPNPATENVTISMPKSFSNAEIRLTNQLGKVMKQSKVETVATQFSTKDLAPGVYFIQIQNEGKLINKKLIVN